MGRLRPNNIQGHSSKISWGIMGKKQTYKNQAFQEQPELTEEERKLQLLKKKASWTYKPGRDIVVGTAAQSTPEPSYTPPADLVVWYDFTDESTVTLSENNRVDTVEDKSGNGYDAGGSNYLTDDDSKYPFYFDTTFNGVEYKSAVFLNNAVNGQALTADTQTFNTTNTRTTFIVGSAYQNGLNGNIYSINPSLTTSDNSARRIGWVGNNRLYSSVGDPFRTDYQNLPVADSSSNAFQFIQGVGEDGVSNTYQQVIYPSYPVINASRSYTMNTRYVVLGKSTVQSGAHSGVILEFLHWNRKLTEEEFDDVSSYLSDKYGFS